MRLLSWNIQWSRGMDGRVEPARVAREIQRIGDFDVICLQEVAINFPGLPGSAGEDQLALLGAGLASYTPIFGAATDVPDGCGGRKLFGNAIFTRLPVGQVFRHLLPWPEDAGVPSMQRILVEAVLESDIGPLRVLTTHLEYYSRRQRAAQVEALRALHAEASAHARRPRPGKDEAGGSFEVFARPQAAILCGDMNFAAEDALRRRLLAPIEQAPAWCDAWEVLHAGEAHAPTVGLSQVSFVDRPACFDFVLVSADLAPRLRRMGVDAESRASDHQPVWVELA